MGETVRYTLEEVAKHDGKDGARVWIVIRDAVYDITDYLEEHPGGGELITEFAGMDGTSGYDEFGHSGDAKNQMKAYKIGELVEEDKRANRKKKQTNQKVDQNSKKTEYKNRRPFLAALCGGCIT